MAYSETLASRIREVLADRDDVDERKMFGGIAFMVRNNMTCGVIGDELMLRVGEARQAEAFAQPHARPMDFTGKPMVGMVYVAPAGFRTKGALSGWIDRALAFVATLPAKNAKAPATKKTAKKKSTSR